MFLTNLRCDSTLLGQYVLLVEFPSHAKAAADRIGGSLVSQGELYHVYTGSLGARKVSIVSCGIGSPAAALVLEDLAQAGVTTVARAGIAQPIGQNTQEGDIVIATAGVKMDGTCGEYVVTEFPAVANFALLRALSQAAEQTLGPKGFKMGIVEGRDVRTRRKDFDRTLVSGSCIYEKALTRGGALCSDMETAAVLVVSRYLGIRAASINLVSQDAEAQPSACVALALKAMEQLIAQETKEDDPCYLT